MSGGGEQADILPANYVVKDRWKVVSAGRAEERVKPQRAGAPGAGSPQLWALHFQSLFCAHVRTLARSGTLGPTPLSPPLVGSCGRFARSDSWLDAWARAAEPRGGGGAGRWPGRTLRRAGGARLALPQGRRRGLGTQAWAPPPRAPSRPCGRCSALGSRTRLAARPDGGCSPAPGWRGGGTTWGPDAAAVEARPEGDQTPVPSPSSR